MGEIRIAKAALRRQIQAVKLGADEIRRQSRAVCDKASEWAMKPQSHFVLGGGGGPLPEEFLHPRVRIPFFGKDTLF